MKIVSVFTVDPFALVVAARFTSVLSGVAVTYFAIKIAKSCLIKIQNGFLLRLQH